MNICLFLISDGWGGAENVVFYLAKYMEEKGHDANIILNEETYPYFEKLKKIDFHNIGSVYNYTEIFKDIFKITIPSEILKIDVVTKGFKVLLRPILREINYRKLRKIILISLNKINPDILHVHNPSSLGLYSHFFKYLRCPVIYTAHGKHSSGKKKGRLLESFDKITAVSNHTRQYLKEKGISSSINVIYNGLDLNNISAFKSKNKKGNRLDKNQFILIFPGGMKPNKGGLILLKAMEILNSKKLPIKLYYSGATSKKFVASNKIENVKFTGFLTHDEYLKKLNFCDCLILLSLIEQCPLSIVEAIALGKAIITTPVGGIPELCLNGRNALYVERNPEDIAEKILYLYKNNWVKNKISKNNFKDAKKFDWNEITDKYIEIYQTLIQ